MNFYIENSPDDAASFGSIVTAGFAANSWLDADPTGKQFRFEIYQPCGKAGGYVVGHGRYGFHHRTYRDEYSRYDRI